MDFCHVQGKAGEWGEKIMRATEIISVGPSYCNLFLCNTIIYFFSRKSKFNLKRKKRGMGLKFTEYLLCAIISYRYYLIYLPPSSIYELEITIVQLIKLRHEEVIWFAQSHTAMMTENSIQASTSRSANPCFSQCHEKQAATNLKYILEETIQIFWGYS